MQDLLKSPRFQALVIIGILQAFVLFNIITSAQGEGLIQIIQGIIAGAIVIRSTDRMGDKKIEAAEIVADSK